MGVDAIFSWKPDSAEESGEYGTKYKATDRFTKLILNNVAVLPMELKTSNLIFNDDKNISDKFIGSVFSVTDSLFKANGHIVDYKDKEKRFEKIFRRTIIKDPNKGKFDIYDDPLDLLNQFDGYLIQIKAALDSLAHVLNPLLNTNFSGWRSKEVGGVRLSGVFILNDLKNKKESELGELIKYLDGTINDISYLVNLRNKPVHFGGNSSLRGFFFNKSNKETTNPVINHPDGTNNTIREFIDISFENIIIFISRVILYSIQYKAPRGIYIEQFTNERRDTEFRWTM
jgi:hypothetical protein